MCRWRRVCVFFRAYSLRPFPGSTWGSKRRNRLSVVTLTAASFLIVDLLAGWHLVATHVANYAICLLAPIYLYQVSLAVIWLEKKENFRVASGRLIRDVSISIAFTISAFSSAYWNFGITPTYDLATPVRPVDCFYFSIVTFTTLGYGDFRPDQATRILAALQALIGTVHIGLIVGAAFITVGDRHS